MNHHFLVMETIDPTDVLKVGKFSKRIHHTLFLFFSYRFSMNWMNRKNSCCDNCRQVIQAENFCADQRQQEGGTAVENDVGQVKTPRTAAAHLKVEPETTTRLFW